MAIARVVPLQLRHGQELLEMSPRCLPDLLAGRRGEGRPAALHLHGGDRQAAPHLQIFCRHAGGDVAAGRVDHVVVFVGASAGIYGQIAQSRLSVHMFDLVLLAALA